MEIKVRERENRCTGARDTSDIPKHARTLTFEFNDRHTNGRKRLSCSSLNDWESGRPYNIKAITVLIFGSLNKRRRRKRRDLMGASSLLGFL